MSARDPLRIGLIGAGMVSHHHLTAWVTIPGARVVAIADPDLGRAQEMARSFGIDAAYQSAAVMLAEQALDAVDIAAPVSEHGALCRMASDRGVSILCQKPLASSVDEARQIIADVGDRVRFMVHENWRFRASYRQIKTWLDAGFIGPVRGVSMFVTSSGFLADEKGELPALKRQPFLAELPRLLVFEVLIHHVDILSWLFGPLSVKAAKLTRTCNAVRGEDTAVIHIETTGGLRLQLEGCLCSPDAPVHIFDRLEVRGERGRIRLVDTEMMLEGDQSSRLVWDFEAMYASAFEGALSHFVAALKSGEPFETEAMSNLSVLQAVEDIYALADWSSE